MKTTACVALIHCHRLVLSSSRYRKHKQTEGDRFICESAKLFPRAAQGAERGLIDTKILTAGSIFSATRAVTWAKGRGTEENKIQIY